MAVNIGGTSSGRDYEGHLFPWYYGGDGQSHGAEALGLFSASSSQAKELRKVLEENDDAEMVCDVLSYHFTRCPKLQQRLMGEPSLIKRYQMVIDALKKTQCP